MANIEDVLITIEEENGKKEEEEVDEEKKDIEYATKLFGYSLLILTLFAVLFIVIA